MDAFLNTLKNTTHSFLSFRHLYVFGLASQHVRFTLAIEWNTSETDTDLRFYDGATFEECRLAYLADLEHAISDQNEHNAQMQEDAENTD
jgi:hypothetical protein